MMDANQGIEGLGLTPTNPKLILGGVMNVGRLLDRRAAVAGGVAQTAPALIQLLTNPPKEAKEQIEGFWRATINHRILVAAMVMGVPLAGSDKPDDYVIAAPAWTKGNMPLGVWVLIRYRFAGAYTWNVEPAIRKKVSGKINFGEVIVEDVLMIQGKPTIPEILGAKDIDGIEWCAIAVPA